LTLSGEARQFGNTVVAKGAGGQLQWRLAEAATAG